MEEEVRKLAISTSQNYPTQFSQDLPEQLLEKASIRQLDSITLHNFKSFRSEHYIGPFLRFTSVVGPNGSGKSNILQALFFCICGQRQKGHRIDPRELICKVEGESLLQFDRDHEECWVQARFLLGSGQYLTAKRQLLVTGESRYFVNGKEYPQKLYQQYLNSQGLLSDVCNFAIFQGETDRLAAMQPKDLRHYLQTLSGSLKYKEAYDTDRQQLERLDRQIEQNTGKITRLKQEKRTIKQVKSTASEYEKLASRFNECVETQFAAKMLLKEIDIKKLQKQLEIKVKQQAKVEEELGHRKAQMQRDYRESIQLQARLAEMQEQRATIAAKLKRGNNHEYAIKERQLFELTKQHQADSEEERMLLTRMTNLEESLPKVALPQQLSEYLSLYQQWEKQNYLLQAEVQKKQLNIAAYDRSIISKQEALNKMKEAKKKGENEQAGKHKKIEELMGQLKNLKAAGQRIKDTIGKANEESKRTAQLISEKEKLISAANQTLQELEGRMLEGVEQHKLRDLLKKLMSVPGFKGRIADKVKPSNKKYAECFGQLLAPIDNNLMVEDQHSAQSLASKLKDLCAIKNVVILSNVVDKDQNIAKFRKELGKNGVPAVDIVDFDRQLSGLEGYLMLALKGKVVCETLDDAFKLKDMNIRSVREIYTLNGSVLREDGMISLSGEPIGNRKTYRFDADGQKKLQKQITTVTKQRQQLQQEMKQLKERVMSSSQRSELTAQLNLLQRKERQTQTEIEYWKQYKARNNNDHEFLQVELAQLRSKRDKLKQALKKLQSSMTESKPFSEFMKKHNISDLSLFHSSTDMKEMQAVYQLRNKITLEVEAIKKRIDTLRRKQLAGRIDRLKGEMDRIGNVEYKRSLEEELRRKEAEMLQIKQRLDKLNTNFEPVKFRSEVPELTQRLRFLQIQKQLYLKDLNEREGLSIMVPEYEKPLKLLRADMDNVHRDRVEELVVKLEEDRKGIETELEKYSSLTILGGTTNEVEHVEKKVKQLEETLDASIEARDRVKQQLAENTQLRSKTLTDFIERLKLVLADAYRTLTETADEKVYGHADLYLENQEHPFLGGIYYSPTPPSKRFVYDVDQLSGGEKSLASIALQFSAAVASRAPFIMLDESDAFLDHNNVQKLINLLLKGIDDRGLQFVVVSHKQPLYGSSDSLVGAMNRDRSSRVFSLKL